MRISKLFSGRQPLALALTLLLAACTPGSGPSDEPLGNAREAVFMNGGFEAPGVGIAPPSWTVQTYINEDITVQSPQTRAGLNLQPGGDALTTQLMATNQADPNLGTGASLRYCRYGQQCAVVNFHSSTTYFHGQNVNGLTQSMIIGPDDIDSFDGQVHVRFAIAPVLQNPNHPAQQQPYYFVQVLNTTKNTILYSDFNLSAQAGVPWKKINGGTPAEIDYVDWALVDIAPGPSKLAQGDGVTLEIIASGCSQGGHYGEVYVDGVGSTVPGLFVSGVGPTQANLGTVVTYDMRYKNGASVDESNVEITFPTPADTTFQAITAPVGAACTSPAVGSPGTITCTFAAPVLAGASGTFQISVNLLASATGTLLVAGSYGIRSTQETTLIGSKILTTIGCAADAECGTGKWCNVLGKTCMPTLVNGAAIPTDTSHSNPTLNGACSVAAGALVCQSAVCDTDNLCGKKNSSGVCTLTNQAVICRSGVCDADGSCGYATNHGPCTAGNAGTVCRSGSCSTNLLCQPALGCNVDADCTGGKWCDETAHACTPKLTNGSNIPIDVPHTAPILDGNCTAAVGTLVCAASVCDTADSKCGYADNHGPCTAGNAGTVCRSGSCSSNLLCRPASGCNVDADCTGGKWCNEASHVCSVQLANGIGMPTDVPHSNPTLDGSCSVAAGSLVCLAGVCDVKDDKCGKQNGSGSCTLVNQATVCRSGVCDADGSCGYATDHGPCSAVNAATVCRSGSCSANLLCQPAGGCNIDGDCADGQWCNETSHTCSAKLTNGSSIPSDPPHTGPLLSGACTPSAATLVCTSSVCDGSDDKCGYALNSGPCSSANAATVCRTGSCSSNLLCQPVGGCNVDADCTAGNWCNETLHACTPTLANNTAIPTDTPHASPTLNAVCTSAASALVCQSAVCDVADDKCGYDVGHGPCTIANAAIVCRSGACGSDGNCRPAGGCNLDADCAAGKWCQQSSHSCEAMLANGSPLPTDAPHTNPTLDGSCTVAAATLVCQSAVCDSADNQCGLAAGQGPCTTADGIFVCRSAVCSANGLCQPAAGCNVDADCPGGKWCNEATGACLPLLGNGTPLPSDTPHVSPTLDGTCSEAAASLVCVSGVCDTNDDECGFASGVGPCSAANAGSVCRSGRCATTGPAKGTCVNCTEDAHCAGDAPICNPSTGNCVACISSRACSGDTPICDLSRSICVRCNGDRGSTASSPCATDAAPFCFLSGPSRGSCGKCASDTNCTGHVGNVCDSSGGLCKSGCRLDTDCSSSEWCNESEGMCTPKLANGTPLPGEPERVATCSADVASIVCRSAVCDPVDGSCGLAPGDGPCTDLDHCRLGSCNFDTQLCSNGCTGDADCATSEYCGSAGACTELLPVGAECSTNNQCKTHDCTGKICTGLVASGAGVACATRPIGGSGASIGSGLVLALIGVVACARRRRARRPTRAAA